MHNLLRGAAAFLGILCGLATAIVVFGWLSLVIWDRTHQPAIPGWSRDFSPVKGRDSTPSIRTSAALQRTEHARR